MTSIHKSALVAYCPAQMFKLVDDIDSYASFLPWCKSSRVLSRNDEVIEASIELSRSGVEKSFTTRNRVQKNKIIEMRLLEGPFKRLEGYWRFDPLGEDGCKISLDLEFDFSSRVLGLVVGPVFGQIANSLVDSFHARAKEIYGKC